MDTNLTRVAAVATIIGAIFTVRAFYNSGSDYLADNSRQKMTETPPILKPVKSIVSVENSTENDTLFNIKGKWFGRVTDKGRSYYDVEMLIEHLDVGEYSGKTVYSDGINCSGLNTFEKVKSSIYVFKEVINRGQGCSNQGRIEVYMDNGKLNWEWYRLGSGGTPEASAVLRNKLYSTNTD